MNDQEWHYKYSFLSNRGKLEMSNNLYLHYKHKGCIKDKNDVPDNNSNDLDLVHNEYDFDFKCDNLEDSNCKG